MMEEKSGIKKILLKNIGDCSVEQQIAVLHIRNQDSIRDSLHIDHKIEVNEHLIWISNLIDDEKQKVFAVLDNDNPVGIVGANKIDSIHKKTDWEFYLDENQHNGLDIALELAMIDHVFETIQFEKINCEVIETNPSVVKMHLRFGFAEEGFRRSNLVKDGKRVGVHLLGLTKEDWIKKQNQMRKSIVKITSKFQIEFCDEADKEALSPLDAIRKARAKNNVNWMALLKLSLEHNPDVAKPIVSEILRLDQEISEYTRRLVE